VPFILAITLALIAITLGIIALMPLILQSQDKWGFPRLFISDLIALTLNEALLVFVIASMPHLGLRPTVTSAWYVATALIVSVVGWFIVATSLSQCGKVNGYWRIVLHPILTLGGFCAPMLGLIVLLPIVASEGIGDSRAMAILASVAAVYAGAVATGNAIARVCGVWPKRARWRSDGQ
jgi:hypothetical protein